MKHSINANNVDTSPLRSLFETANITKPAGKEADIVQEISKSLCQKHQDQVNGINQSKINTWGGLLVNLWPETFGFIDTLSGGSLGQADVKDGAVAYIMGYSQSVSGHGIRYLKEYGVTLNGDIRTTGPMSYRGAYASEQDHRERNYDTIKVLEVKGDDVIIGVASGKQLLIQKINPKKHQRETLETYDLEQERNEKEKAALKETLTSNRKDNIKNLRSLVSNSCKGLESTEDPIILDDCAIFPVVQYDQSYDATDRSYKLYLVDDKHPEPTLIHSARCNYNPNTSGRFFRNKANFVKITKSNPNTLIVDIRYRHSSSASVPGYAYTLSEDQVTVDLTGK